MDSKTCASCKIEQVVSEFAANPKMKSGLHSYCHVCRRRRMRETYARHRRSRIDRVNAYQAKNPAQVAETKRRWMTANPAKRRETKRRWQQANMATFVRASNARRRAVKLNAPTLPFHPSLILARWEYYAGRCWICRGEAKAMDHVKPLTKGGWHIPANLRPVCTACNTRKRDIWPFAA